MSAVPLGHTTVALCTQGQRPIDRKKREQKGKLFRRIWDVRLLLRTAPSFSRVYLFPPLFLSSSTCSLFVTAVSRPSTFVTEVNLSPIFGLGV